MSCGVIIQGHDIFYIGADSALSVAMHDGIYRISDYNSEKIFLLPNKVIFMSGRSHVTNDTISEFKLQIDQSLDNLISIFKKYHNSQKSCFADSSLTICTFENGIAVSNIIESNSDFKIRETIVQPNNFKSVVCGSKNEEASKAINRYINQGLLLDHAFINTFNDVASAEIGGTLSVYKFTVQETRLYLKTKITDPKDLKKVTVKEAAMRNPSLIRWESVFK